MLLELTDPVRQALPKEATFDHLLDLRGEVFREVKHRRTSRVEIGGRHYFLKVHRGPGWGEIFKDLFQARLPVVSARTEWEAIEQLQTLGIEAPRIAGKGWRGANPAARESFLLTEELPGMLSLESLLVEWKSWPARKRIRLKHQLIEQVAQIARAIHGHGLNHRDFYLCHFLISRRVLESDPSPQPPALTLIDLHRMQHRAHVPRRWLVKDLAGLLFSALDAPLGQRDCLRFLRTYRGEEWRGSLNREGDLWRAVQREAARLYQEFHHRRPPEWLDAATNWRKR